MRGRTRRFLLPPWWFAAPALIVYVVVVLYPTGAGVVYLPVGVVARAGLSVTSLDELR